MIQEALELLTHVTKYVPPGPQAREIINKYRFKRSAALSYLEPIKHGDDRICAWCNESPLADRRRKYCGTDCSDSAEFNFYPQKNAAKMWILIHRQQCACVGCGESFEDQIVAKAKDVYNRLKKTHDNYGKSYGWPPFTGIGYFHIGDCTGHIYQVDHKEAIFRGGDGLGIDSVQVLCVPCHKKKSANEKRIK